jgi:hypothetical protein
LRDELLGEVGPTRRWVLLERVGGLLAEEHG